MRKQDADDAVGEREAKQARTLVGKNFEQGQRDRLHPALAPRPFDQIVVAFHLPGLWVGRPEDERRGLLPPVLFGHLAFRPFERGRQVRVASASVRQREADREGMHRGPPGSDQRAVVGHTRRATFPVRTDPGPRLAHCLHLKGGTASSRKSEALLEPAPDVWADERPMPLREPQRKGVLDQAVEGRHYRSMRLGEGMNRPINRLPIVTATAYQAS